MRRVILTIVGLVSYVFCSMAQITITGKVTGADDGLPLPQTTVLLKGTRVATPTDADGNYQISVPNEGSVLVFRFLGYVTQEIQVSNRKVINVQLQADAQSLGEVVVIGYGISSKKSFLSSSVTRQSKLKKPKRHVNESYAKIEENAFHRIDLKPLSTFSVDVDVASYANVRRMLNEGSLPPKDAVRIEELVNYFSFDYPQPQDEKPFSVHTEYTECPWEPKHQLLKVGIQGKDIVQEDVPRHNLVFLIDVSGSMGSANKLPLVKESLRLLVNKLRPQDQVAIVVYAGAAGAVLKPTKVRHKGDILEAIERLHSGGSTAGGEGIELAYALAEQNYDKRANNRIILATDGDFNIGQSTDKSMETLIESKRDKGIFLTCLGFGMGNYKDSKLEILADKGNGNYAYIDDIWEARKVLVEEMNGTLITVAKDVKIQVEFNPEQVAGYRLIGYENRVMEDVDFVNDGKDAGDIGAGQQVTALYEVIPAGVESEFINKGTRLRYGKIKRMKKQFSEELGLIKFRYKDPLAKKSQGFAKTIGTESLRFEQCSTDLQFAAAVTMFGMILRDSEYQGTSNFQTAMALVKASEGADADGLRSQFRSLVSKAMKLRQDAENE